MKIIYRRSSKRSRKRNRKRSIKRSIKRSRKVKKDGSYIQIEENLQRGDIYYIYQKDNSNKLVAYGEFDKIETNTDFIEGRTIEKALFNNVIRFLDSDKFESGKYVFAKRI